MAVGIHQSGRHQPSGQIQLISIRAAGFFDLGVTADVGDAVIGNF